MIKKKPRVFIKNRGFLGIYKKPRFFPPHPRKKDFITAADYCFRSHCESSHVFGVLSRALSAMKSCIPRLRVLTGHVPDFKNCVWSRASQVTGNVPRSQKVRIRKPRQLRAQGSGQNAKHMRAFAVASEARICCQMGCENSPAGSRTGGGGSSAGHLWVC